MAEKKKTTPREAAYKSLLKCSQYNKYSNLEVSSMIGYSDFSDADRRLYTLLVYGVTERAVTLDYIISKLSSRPCDKIDRETLCALRLGIYQLKYTDRIPDHAAVSETVALVRASSRGFVNALLREFIRRGKNVSMPSKNEENYLSVTYSAPKELCDFLTDKIGFEKTENLFKGSLAERGVDIRVNTLVTSAAELLKEKFQDGEVSPICDSIIRVPSVSGEDFSTDKWFVQDAASAVTAEALGAVPGETVIDTCAAPGGKSFSVAVNMKNEGKVYSFDLHENKASLIRSGAERLGIKIIEADCNDASNPRENLVGKADRVLCDAPCSGLGVIGKKPDIKYKAIGDIERLPAVQLRVLQGASAYVKSGGVLVYSTCTVNPDENEKVAETFLKANCDFALSPLNVAGCTEPMKTFYPIPDGTDGFFLCKMIRKEK